MLNDVPTFATAYLVGCCIVGTLVAAWFETGFPLMVLGRFYPGLTSSDKLLMNLVINPPFGLKPIGKLLNCPICLGTWLSLLVSLTIWLTGGYGSNHWPVIFAAIGWPFVIHSFTRSQ